MPRGIYEHQPWTAQARANHIEALKRPEMRAVLVANGRSRTREANGNWRGDDTTSRQIHLWLVYNYGLADHCEVCGDCDPSRRYVWANINGHRYSHNRADYRMMCYPCHTKYDWTNKRREGIWIKKYKHSKYIRVGVETLQSI